MEIKDVDLKFNSNFETQNVNNINMIVLHHTGVNVIQSVQAIHEYHKTRGYAGIGYHFYVKQDGSIYKGRPLNMVGAHSFTHNRNSIGIACER